MVRVRVGVRVMLLVLVLGVSAGIAYQMSPLFMNSDVRSIKAALMAADFEWLAAEKGCRFFCDRKCDRAFLTLA